MIRCTSVPKSRRLPLSLSLQIAALAALLTLGSSARADNIVADPGFESAGGGSITYATSSIDGSWTVTQGAVYIDTVDPWVYDGANSANLTGANIDAPTSLEQTLTTISGLTYEVSFWANADIPNSFSLTENGNAVSGTPNTIAQNGFPDQSDANGNSAQFVDYTGSFLATSTSTDLTFTATGTPPIGSPNYSVIVDDVDVTPTPEPGSFVLLLSGLLGVGLLMARKRLVSAGSFLA